MPRRFLLPMVACLSLLPAAFAQNSREEIIPAGTLLQCTISEPNFSSKTAMLGDPVLCHLGSLVSFGHSFLPRGAELSGHLQDFKNPGHFFGKGWIDLQFDRLILPGGDIVPLTVKVISAPHLRTDKEGKIHGKGHPRRDAIEWMVPILWPVKVLTLPARGPYPTLKGETRVSVRVMDDILLQRPQVSGIMPSQNSSGHYSESGFRPFTGGPPSYRAWHPTYQTGSSSRAEENDAIDHPPTLIALKDGMVYVARKYWVDGARIYCVDENGEKRLFALQRIDLGLTVRLNRERNVDFALQSRDGMGEY